jgi:arylsulfatase A-like enzyme
MYVLSSLTQFAIWGLLESFIPLPPHSGTILFPIHSSNASFLIYLAVSVVLYAIAGIVVGALSGGLAIIVPALLRGSLRPKEGSAPVSAPGRTLPRGFISLAAGSGPPIIYNVVLAWAILSSGGLYYINRLLPEGIMSSRSLFLGAALLGLLSLVALASFVTAARMARYDRGSEIIRTGSHTVSRIVLVLVGLSAGIASLAYVKEKRFPAPAALLRGDHPNVILVSIDALRPDHLSCYGYPLPTSPAIDELAGQGVLFGNACCQAPSSTPSHASMLTGLYPAVHGALSNGNLLSDEVLTVQEIFRDADYETGAFITNPWISSEFGFSQGFDIFVEDGILQSAAHYDMCQFASNLWLFEAWDKIRARDLSFVRALRWIRRHEGRTFFLFLHLLDPHAPYDPPDGYTTPFLPVGADRVARTVAAYDGEIRFADEKIGSLVEEIKALGLWENTLICLTSDHGESMGEHDSRFGHGTLYETNLRVPLILVYPGILTAGRTISSPVESVDIVPTFLRLAGVEVPEELDGMDLSPLVVPMKERRKGGEDPDSVESGMGAHHPGLRPVFAQKVREYAIRRGDWKIAWNEPENLVELYNLSLDPLERKNIAVERRDVIQELLPILSGWVEEGNSRARESLERTGELDAVTRERLRALGYLQ